MITKILTEEVSSEMQTPLGKPPDVHISAIPKSSNQIESKASEEVTPKSKQLAGSSMKPKRDKKTTGEGYSYRKTDSL